jgi:hypothetical protein
MSADTAVPTPQSPNGCLGKGCLIAFGLFILLMAALTLGATWGIHYLRQTYSQTQRMELRTPETPGVAEASPSTKASPAAALQNEPVPEQLREVQTRWDRFESAARRQEKTRIELTAAEINMLVQADRELRGKAVVSIENNIGRVRLSIPLNEMFMMEGRYLNGEATVEASPDGDPAKARITNIVLADQPVPDAILDRRIFGWLPIRMLINQWLQEHDVAIFSIWDGKVIGETRGTRE